MSLLDGSRRDKSPMLLRCSVCGAEVAAETDAPWRCPNATEADRQHVLHRVAQMRPLRPLDHRHPLVRFDPQLLWARIAEVHGLDLDARIALVLELDAAVGEVDGRGFVETPFARADQLSEALGFRAEGGIWIKDETVDVAGSAKARHLVSILLHLLAMEACGVASPQQRAPLAIASCGNAALAAATLAAAVRWPIEVFVPTVANPAVIERLTVLGAHLNVCPRRHDDPPGDPCIHRFREAVSAGAVPFSVQGPENALCLDAGRTIAWECTEMLGARIDRFFAQVGGGALATSIGFGCVDAGTHPRLLVVQVAGCAPMVRAWERWKADPAATWAQCMWPWTPEPHSIAGGILDDETYDWLGVALSLRANGGTAEVVSEAQIIEANRLVEVHTDIDADHTGTAALAGVLALRSEIADDEVLVVPVTGTRR
ncbi:MAG: PLP-dependent lyase/thiolase [Acidimicrobiia bacterium]